MKEIVAIYCRLSEEDRNKQNETDDSNSIQNQKAMLIEYAEERGWKIYQIYSDDDYTGSDRNRPAFRQMLRDAEEKKFNIILCKSQSRFTRELELVEKYINGIFPIWGIRFVSIVDNADTANKGNKKSRQINGLVNEWYLEDMSDNIRSVLTNRRKNGFHIGAFALYGYKKDPEQKGHLIVDEKAAAVVREVFTLFAQGYGKTAIARMLNDRGIPNPTEYKRLCGLRYRGAKSRNSTLWKYYSIGDILKNEIYIGNMVQGKYGSVSYKTKQSKPRPKREWYIVKGTHEPIIDRDLWDRVQRMLAQRSKPFQNGKIGIFAQKVRCANCGYTLQSCKSAPQRGSQHYLHCPNRHYAKDSCAGAFISVNRLEQYVLKEIDALAEQYLDKDELEQKLEFDSTMQRKKKQILAEIAAYEKKAREYATGIRDLYLDKVRGLLSECDYLELSQNFAEDRSRIQALIEEKEKQLADVEEKLEAGDTRRAIIEKYAHLDHLPREIVEILIDYITVGKRVPGTRNVPIEIHWNI